MASPSSNDDMLRFIKALELNVEAVEAERKKDIEKVEAQMKKDLEKDEAQMKKDLEKVEAQRKKDLEIAEAQTEKLKLDLEGKIERLKRPVNERDLEQKRANEATKRFIESLAEEVDATNDFLAVGVCLLYIHPLEFHIRFYPGTRRRWINSSVENFLTVLKHLLRCSWVWAAATPAMHLLTLEMHLVFRRLFRNGNNVSLRSLQRRKMKFRRRPFP